MAIRAHGREEATEVLFVGVDIGGTFTDLLAYEVASGRVRSVKSLTTYDDPPAACSTASAWPPVTTMASC